MLQIARSYVPGGLAGWIIWPKPEPLAALENTVEVDERMASDGSVIRELDVDDVRAQLGRLAGRGIQALAVSLINSFADPAHERRSPRSPREVLPGVPVSLSSRRAARAARVRAHPDHGGQRLRPAAGAPLHAEPLRPAAQRRGGR